jgi:DNA-binding LytR/AlgR family response regulator
MFHVAICDDNVIFLSDFKKRISSILSNYSIPFEIDCYSSVCEFIQEINCAASYQLIFLDIEFPNEDSDGVCGASFVRRSLIEANSHIVFISSQPKYAMQLFDFQPLQFLIKPIPQEKLINTIEKSVYFWNCSNRIFHFISNRQEMAVEIQQITYIESYGRKKILHCLSNKVYPINDSFSNVLNQLEQYNFFSPHKSYIVNYQKVSSWHKDSIIMEDGVSIPIGRTQIKKVQEIQLRNYFN